MLQKLWNLQLFILQYLSTSLNDYPVDTFEPTKRLDVM